MDPAVAPAQPAVAGFARHQRRGPFWLIGLLGLSLGLVWVARALALGLPALAAEPALPAPPPAPPTTSPTPPTPARGPVAAGMDGDRESNPDPAVASNVDPKQDLIRMLGATGPHASLQDQAGCFDRFVGTWDCDYALFSPEGKVTRLSGQAVFGWVLDGRAMQDVWWSRSGPGRERNLGTTLRFYDRKAGLWHVTWVAPGTGSGTGAVILLEGGPVGDDGRRIVLNGKDTDGSLTRWSFSDIEAGAFVWRSENSRDGGKTWVRQEEHHLKRHH